MAQAGERDAALSGGEDATAWVEEGRRAWEAAAEAANRALDTEVTPAQIGGVRGEWVARASAAEDRAILFLHGGGYNTGSPRTHREFAARLSTAARVPVLLVDYRLAPEHPFPAAVEDAAAAYRRLLEWGFPAAGIAIGGDSAGGGLALAALLALRDEGAELPAAAFLLSPWVDLALSGPSIEANAALDPVVTAEALQRAARLYLGGRDPRDPLASPLYAGLDRLPPTLAQVGEREILLSDATRLAEEARAAGTEVELQVWEGMSHVWHLSPDLPGAGDAVRGIGAWLSLRLATLEGPPRPMTMWREGTPAKDT